MTIEFQPIGTIHTPFDKRQGMPIQPTGATGVRGTVVVLPEFVEGLDDLDGFSHVMLLYQFHAGSGYSLRVTPFLDDRPRGLFSTRAPRRPNPIGVSVVRLLGIEGGVLEVENVDMLDGTPLLDIKPYVPEFDNHPAERLGWLDQAQGRSRQRRSDDRFC